jgi:hypothetical protein
MSNDDLVSVMVPRKHLTKIYGLIAQLDGASETRSNTEAEDGVFSETVRDEWTPSRIRTAVEQSPPAMRDILRALAERAGEWLTTHELAQAIQANPDADWKTVAGTLGAFGRRITSRYGLESLPFDGKYDHAAGCRVHRMSADMGRQILQALETGE